MAFVGMSFAARLVKKVGMLTLLATEGTGQLGTSDSMAAMISVPATRRPKATRRLLVRLLPAGTVSTGFVTSSRRYVIESARVTPTNKTTYNEKRAGRK